MKICFGDCSSRGRKFCELMGKRKRWGGQPGRTFHGTGGQSGTHHYKCGRTCPASTHLWLQQILQSPRLRRQPQRTQAGVSRTRPSPLATPGGTGGGHRTGGRAGTAAGAVPYRRGRQSERRPQHRELPGGLGAGVGVMAAMR